jgi:anti-sigma B factor antagonist
MAGPGTDMPLRLSLRPRGPIHLGVSEHQRADASLIHVDGELDILTAPRLAIRINEVLRECSGNVVLDLREVVFIDSAGLQVMLGARRRLARASRELTVVCREGPVRRVIEMARLIGVLGVVPDAD